MRLRWHWGTGIAAVYAVFAAATTGFALFALDQKVELVSDDYYERSLQQDRRMDAEANASALGDAFRVERGRHEIAIVWARAAPASGAGTVTFYRPSEAAFDRQVAAAPDAAGRQRISLADLPAGRWLVQVQWRSGGHEYYAEVPVVAP